MAQRFDDLAQPFRMTQVFEARDVDFLADPIFHLFYARFLSALADNC